jgi:hypothetical protein
LVPAVLSTLGLSFGQYVNLKFIDFGSSVVMGMGGALFKEVCCRFDMNMSRRGDGDFEG